jgi:methylamine dehydrogenase accessory protein MauD
MSALVAALAFAWIAIIALTLTVLALARQIGVLHERISPIGALTMEAGPKSGQPAPLFDLPDIAAPRRIRIGGATGRTQMLFFLSTTCPVCKKLLPILRMIAADERRTTDIILASDGDTEEHQAFLRREKLAFPYVLSAELGITYQISRLPYAVVIAPDGLLAAKGLVNNREQIESLLVARELGVSSLQDYVARESAKLETRDDAVV